MENRQSILREIPKIDELLLDEQLIFFMESTPRAVIVNAAREITERVRTEILVGNRKEAPDRQEMVSDIRALVEGKKKHSLRHLVNASGVILHTNLGRANLCQEAVKGV